MGTRNLRVLAARPAESVSTQSPCLPVSHQDRLLVSSGRTTLWQSRPSPELSSVLGAGGPRSMYSRILGL